MTRYMVGDFETTVTGDKEQDSTEVWSSAIVELYTEDVIIFHSIDDTLLYLESLTDNIVLYYHNLKFDGQFWIDYLIRNTNYEQAYAKEDDFHYTWIDKKRMKEQTFKYSVSDMGQWYTITLKTPKGTFIEMRDSAKLLPFSVKRIGESFKTKHKKLDMEYVGERYAGCVITDEEKEYIRNDVLVVKEALEIMFEEGHTKLTIGSCCLAEFKKTVHSYDYKNWFPNLYEHSFKSYPRCDNTHYYGSENIGEYIRKSYKGGWCYLVPAKKQKVFHNGTTADVNSLYPSMMHSESGNYYPLGYPTFWTGEIPDEAIAHNKFYFVRIKTRFKLKKDMLPTIQIKNSVLYDSKEWLETSDARVPKNIRKHPDDEFIQFYKDTKGNIVECKPTLTLTMIDYKLFCEHYELIEPEFLDGCWFYSDIGIFDQYIDKYKKQKQTSKGARRESAKLFLNNLYGKMASNTSSSFKVAFMTDDEIVKYLPVEENNKKPGYIPVGSAITSYARNFTIRAAQKNYHGADQRGFIYADTDSIHCDLPKEDIVGINVHPTDFCCWKLEASWDVGFFSRQKTYIEHVTHEDGVPVDSPYYSVKAASMSSKSKELFIKSLTHYEIPEDERENYTDSEIQFIEQHHTIDDFKTGLIIPSGRLRPKRVKGGIVLVEQEHEMRG